MYFDRTILLSLTLAAVTFVSVHAANPQPDPQPDPQSASEISATTATKIARAMTAGPASIAEAATIMDVDGTILRAGTNGWMCMPSVMVSDEIPMCNDATWMALMGAFAKGEDFKADKVGVSYMFAGDILTNNDDPTDTTQDPGERWVQEGPHIMIVVPNAASLEGISTDPENGGPYVMWKGTPYQHIMIPTAPRISADEVEAADAKTAPQE